MNTSGEDQLRIGDAERATAERLLRDQASAGRLDPTELADRIATVRSARTRSDLQPAFVELPVDVPPAESAEPFTPYPGIGPYGTVAPTAGAEVAPTVSGAVEPAACGTHSVPEVIRKFAWVIVPLVWIAVFALNARSGWNLWWLFVVAVTLTWWLPQATRKRSGR